MKFAEPFGLDFIEEYCEQKTTNKMLYLVSDMSLNTNLSMLCMLFLISGDKGKASQATRVIVQYRANAQTTHVHVFSVSVSLQHKSVP